MKPSMRNRNRGEATRQQLVHSAIEIFGRDGFHAASTREIAMEAGVNQALIGYHFGGKDALYLAAMEYIGSRIQARLAPLAEQIEKQLQDVEDNCSSTAKKGMASFHLPYLLQLIEGFVNMLIDEESAAWARLILREQQAPSPAFDIFYDTIMKRLLQLATRLIASVKDIDPTSEEAHLLALTIIGQAIVFRASRAAVLKHMGWNVISSDNRAMIQQQIRRNITLLLTGKAS